MYRPFMPLAAGVSTISAPKTFSRHRRSMLMLSGIVKITCSAPIVRTKEPQSRRPGQRKTEACVALTDTLNPISLVRCKCTVLARHVQHEGVKRATMRNRGDTLLCNVLLRQ